MPVPGGSWLPAERRHASPVALGQGNIANLFVSVEADRKGKVLLPDNSTTLNCVAEGSKDAFLLRAICLAFLATHIWTIMGRQTFSLVADAPSRSVLFWVVRFRWDYFYIFEMMLLLNLIQFSLKSRTLNKKKLKRHMCCCLCDYESRCNDYKLRKGRRLESRKPQDLPLEEPLEGRQVPVAGARACARAGL